MPRPESAAAGLSVLVTAVTSHSGIAVVRSLGKAGVHVLGATHKPFVPGLHSRYSEPYCRYPSPHEPGFAQRLIELVGETHPDIFFPTSTATVGVASKQRAQFERLTSMNVPPHEGFLAAFDNARTMEECRSLSIPCPRVLTLAEAERLLQTRSPGSPPPTVVVKPRGDYGSAQGVSFCQDVESLLRKIEDCRARFGEPILQEFIPGGSDAMHTVLILFDRRARLIAYFTTRKIRQWPVTGGITAMSVSTDEPGLVSQVLPFFERWKWQGVAEVELKLDPRDGKAKLIEINPRIVSYIGFPVRCGLDLPRLAVLAAADRLRRRGCPTYAVGVRYVYPRKYLRAVMSDFADGHRRLAVLRQVWQEVRHTAVLSSVDITDPLPRLGQLAVDVRSAVLGSPGLAPATRAAGVARQ